MSLISKPADFTGAVVTVDQLNLLKNTIYDNYGTTTNNQGSINDANISLTAAIQRSKIADAALVSGNAVTPGTQTVTRPTTFAGSLLMTLGTFGAIAEPNIAGVGRARITAAVTIKGFLGFTEGQILFVLPTVASVVLSNNDGTATAGAKIYTNTGANKTLTANMAYQLIYDNAAWHEV